MDRIICELIYLLVYTINFTVVIYKLSANKLDKNSLYILTAINYFMLVLLNMNNYENVVLIYITISVIIYLYIKHKNLLYSIFITALSIILVGVSDSMIGLILTKIFNLTRIEILNNFKLYFTSLMLIVISCYIISSNLTLVLEKLYDVNSIFRKYFKESILLISYLIVVVLFIILLRNLYIKYSYIGNTIILVYSTLVLYSFLIIILLMVTTYSHIKKNFETEYIEKEHKQLEQYTNMLEVTTGDLRKFRHDYFNILKTFKGYIDEENIDGLRKYYCHLLEESEAMLFKDKSYVLLQNIKINPLKSLVCSKIIAAQSMGLNVHIEISDEIDILPLKLIDICRIIGILLDNAIEAATDSAEKLVHFIIINNSKEVIFIIKNSCSEETPPVYKIYEKNFSTKGLGRGLGLKTVRDMITDKYSSQVLLNTKKDNLSFIQELIIDSS